MPFIENHASLLHVLGAPFTPFYALGTGVRNLLYKSGWKKQTAFPFPVICVGNLCAGGSGKTPATEYLVRLLSPFYPVGVVSRGYGRKNKENLLAEQGMDASQIGDEPLQYLQKFGAGLPYGFSLYIAARRAEGIRALMNVLPPGSPVVLDDAFQHRAVLPGLSLLLTEYNKPYFKDRLLPWGNLREGRRQAERAHIIVVTKCPEDMGEKERTDFLAACKPLPHQSVYFSTIAYEKTQLAKNIVLMTGIAHPEPMEEYLQQSGYNILRHFRFGDHHDYMQKELQAVEAFCRQAEEQKKEVTLLTTEKDFARLYRTEALKALNGRKLSVLPIRMRILFGETERFNGQILEFVRSYQTENINTK